MPAERQQSTWYGPNAGVRKSPKNDNSGRVRCRELLTKNLRNFERQQHYTEEEADAKMSRRFMSINVAKPIETVEQFPFVLCAWPSFADQPYITNYRIYDDRVGETTRLPTVPSTSGTGSRSIGAVSSRGVIDCAADAA
jgi:hypothetical protein